jgi:cell division protein FtsB
MEYTQGIYLNRWLIVFHILFNYNFKQIFAFARSANEVRESIVKMLGFDFLFLFGDELISGQAAKFFQKKHVGDLEGIELTRKGPIGLTLAKPMKQIEQEIKNLNKPELEALVSKLARYNYRSGLLAAAGLLGVFLSVINALQTKKTIKDEGGSREDATSEDTLSNNPRGEDKVNQDKSGKE